MADEQMHRPAWQNVLSFGNAMSVASMLLMVGGSYSLLNYRMDQAEVYRKERSASTDERFAELNRTVAVIPQLAYRMNAAEEQLRAVNERLDASFRAITARLDSLAETTAQGTADLSRQIGALDTKVAVITQRLEQVSPEKRARFQRQDFAGELQDR